MKSQRLAALSGVAFVVAIVAAFVGIAGDTPQIDDSASTIVNYYNDNQGKETAAALVVMAMTRVGSPGAPARTNPAPAAAINAAAALAMTARFISAP